MKIHKIKIGKWELISRVMRTFEFLLVICTMIFTINQIDKVKFDNTNTAVQILWHFDQEFNKEINQKIFIASGKKSPILIKNGGEFTEDELGEYLAEYEQLGDLYLKQIVPLDLIRSWFSDQIEIDFKNPEIKDYIVSCREEGGEEYYQAFEQLANEIKK